MSSVYRKIISPALSRLGLHRPHLGVAIGLTDYSVGEKQYSKYECLNNFAIEIWRQ